ncbi:MAG: glycosyltransferase family 39 protein [Myxococcota bacterium]
MASTARRLSHAAALGAIGVYLVVALLRVDYPFEIEWMEGGALGHVERILAGEPLYAPPSLNFTAFVYTPLYFWLASVFSAVSGGGFAPLRAVSLVASLLCFALVGHYVARESGDRGAGWLAAGLLAATFEISGSWFDLARIDSLFLAWTLAAVTALRFGRSAFAGVFAGLLAAAAFFTKQSALPVFAPFLLCAWVERRALWGAFFATFAAVVATGCIALDTNTDGWFSYYAFELPAQHALRWRKLESFWRWDLIAKLPIATLAAAAFFARSRTRVADGRRFHACLAFGLIGSSLLARLHSGGYVNVLMPAYSGIAIFAGLAAVALPGSVARVRRPAAVLAIFSMFLIQFGLLAYDPRSQLPGDDDRAAGEALLATIRAEDGDVLVVHHGYLPGLVGKPTSSQWMAVRDVLRAGRHPAGERLRAEVIEAITARRYAAIIVDGDWFEEDLLASYALRGPVFDGDVFWPVTGHPTRPEWIYEPRSSSP